VKSHPPPGVVQTQQRHSGVSLFNLYVHADAIRNNGASFFNFYVNAVRGEGRSEWEGRSELSPATEPELSLIAEGLIAEAEPAISMYPGKGKQTTGNVLLVASTPYYIYVKEEFKAEIIAKIDEIRGVPHLPSSNKHALLSKNFTMITPQFVQVLQDAFVDSVIIVGYGQKTPLISLKSMLDWH
jgi:hypothetical protein